MKYLKKYENLFDKAKEKETDLKIYMDMDGCLTDFDKSVQDGFLRQWNKDNKTKIKDGWGFEAKYGPKIFWTEIEKMGLEFWSEMPWTKDGKKLWNFVKNMNVEILSTPSKEPDSLKGKYIWCERELGDVKVTLTRQKQNKANSKSILIDDLKKNIDKFTAAGGIGILHKNTEDTLTKLKKIIENNG